MLWNNRIQKENEMFGIENDKPYHMSFEWTPARLLKVDHTYQRPQNKPWIKWLFNNWDIEKCGPLEVSRRSDGSLWIREGQQRHAAAMLKDPDMLLPVCVRTSQGVAKEAGEYLSANHKKKQKVGEIWTAKIVEGMDPIYLDANAVLDKHGLHVSDSGMGSVSAVGALVTITKRFGADYLDAAISYATNAFAGESEPFQGIILKGISTLLYRNNERSIDAARLLTTMQRFSIDKWKGLARDKKESGGNTEGRQMAAAFADEYNKGLRNEARKLVPFTKRIEGDGF